MNDDSNEQWHLPSALRITNPKVALESAELRKQLQARAVSPFARMSAVEFGRVRAKARIEHLSMAIVQVDQELKQPQGPYAAQQLRKAKRALSIRLAENLAVAGRIDLAADVEPRPEYKQEYLKQMRAVSSRKR